MPKFLDAIGGAIASGARKAYNISDRGQEERRLKISEETARRAAQQQDRDFIEAMQGKGAHPIVGGAVNYDGVVRPADKSRTVKYRTSAGEDVMFELPTPEEQLRQQAKLQQESFNLAEPIRAATNAEKIGQAEAEGRATYAGRGAGQLEADTLYANERGAPLPSTIAEKLGMTGDKNYAPEEIYKFGQVAGQLTPEPAKAGTAHYETDPQGNVTAIIPNADGTFKTQNLGKIGTGEKAGGSGGLTAYQGYQISRDAKQDEDASYQRKKRAAQDLQGQLEDLDSREQAIYAENEGLKSQLSALSAIETGGLNPGDRAKHIKDTSEIRAKLAANIAKAKSLSIQKSAVDRRRQRAIEEYAPGTQGLESAPPAYRYNPQTGQIEPVEAAGGGK